MLAKINLRERERCSTDKWLMAFATLAICCKFVSRQSVYTITKWANDMYGDRHDEVTRDLFR